MPYANEHAFRIKNPDISAEEATGKEDCDIEHKMFAIEECKSEMEKDDKGIEATYISGYANTKNKADSYGDIPMNYNGKDVYDLTRMKTNPVMLVDHYNSLSRIMGNFVKLHEDEKGLFFKVKLKNIEDSYMPEVKEAIQNFKSGFGRALSIGGRWLYENPDNPKQLTKAIIHEISGVAVGADSNALSDVEKVKTFNDEESSKHEAEELDRLKKIHGEKKVTKILNKIKEMKNNG